MNSFTKLEKSFFAILVGGLLLGLALTYAAEAKHAVDHAILSGFDFVQAHLVADLFANPYLVGLAIPVLLLVLIVRMLLNQINKGIK